MGDKVLVARPALSTPFMNATELRIENRDQTRIDVAEGYGSHGEPVRCVRTKSGRIAELWLSATRLVREDELRAEMSAHYQTTTAALTQGRGRSRRSD
jgi:hypothetical protein